MTTVTRSPAARPGTTAAARWLPLAVLMAGTFMFVLDFFVVNVALPAIQRGLGAGAGALEWVVAGYGLTTAVFLVTGGRLGDQYGRRRMFAAGLALFVLTSAACGLAPTAGALVAARLAQGLGAAFMSPNVLSIIGVLYTGAHRIRAISVYGMVMGLAAVGGQLIGGLLIGADLAGWGWRAVFWVNVPIGAAALAAVRLIPESRAGRGNRLDLGGVALITVALLAVLLPLIQGRQLGWPAWSWGCLAAGPVLLAGFGWYERALARRGGTPLLDLGVFASRSLRAGLGTQLAFWCQQAACYLFLALYLQQGRGEGPVESGAIFTVLAAGYLATSLRAPALTMRFGRRVVLTGAATAAAGNLLLLAAVGGIGTAGAVAWLFPGLFLVGAGQGLCITPLTTTVLSHASPQAAGSVAGALSTAQQAGNALGVALIGVVFFGALGQGYPRAFGISLGVMAGLLLGVAALSRLLPGRTAAAETRTGSGGPG
jgi:MFS family permease